MLTDIVQKNFDSLRFKISKELHIEEKMNIIDFFGSEYSMVKLLVDNRLSTMRYECELKCENCSRVFKKVENITTFDKFTVNCQTTIDNRITPKVCKHSKREDVVATTLKGRCIKLSPLLILEMGNLKVSERDIEKCISLTHNDRLLSFNLIGYTLLFGNHFSLKTYIDDIMYHYDGMRYPKIQVEKSPHTHKLHSSISLFMC